MTEEMKLHEVIHKDERIGYVAPDSTLVYTEDGNGVVGLLDNKSKLGLRQTWTLRATQKHHTGPKEAVVKVSRTSDTYTQASGTLKRA